MRRKSFAAAVALLGACSATLLVGGTADAAEPIVIGSCATSVTGVPGQPVSLAPSAVLGVVTDAVRAVPILGPPLAGTVNQAFAALPPIPIGALPNGTGYITGGTIATAVVTQVKKIPLLGPAVLAPVVSSVQKTLTRMCGVSVTGANAVAAPVQEGAEAVADASERATGGIVPGAPGAPNNPSPNNPGTGNPGGPGNPGAPNGGAPGPNSPPVGGLPGIGLDLYQPGLWYFGRSPMADYSNIPFARAGMWAPSPGVRYGGGVPGYSPEFGILGDTPRDDGVSVAGRAEALTPPVGQRVEFPVLLAVLILSGVTAALVRTWVLRKVPQTAL
jgi:hypothetical protein